MVRIAWETLPRFWLQGNLPIILSLSHGQNIKTEIGLSFVYYFQICVCNWSRGNRLPRAVYINIFDLEKVVARCTDNQNSAR